MRVLVVGDDTRSFLAVVRSLGRRGHVVHAAPFDHASPALTSRYISAVHRLPPYALDPARWGETLRTLIALHDIELVIPCDDRSVAPLDRHAGAFGRDRLALPNPEAMAIFFDKHETRQLAASLGIPIAPGRLLASDDSAETLGAEFGLPLALKPRTSYALGQTGPRASVRIARQPAALAQALAEIEHRDRWLVEGFFDGTGIGVSVLAAGGRILTAFQHRRLREASETGGSSSRISEALSPPLLAAATALAAATRLDGVAMFEFREDRANARFILLEVNARFWGSLPLAIAAGVDFPALLVASRTDDSVAAPDGYRIGLQRRDLTGEYYRVLKAAEAKGGRLRRGLGSVAGLVSVAAAALTRDDFDSVARDDPAPWHAERRGLAGQLGRAVGKRLPAAAWRKRRAGRAVRRLADALQRGHARVVVLCHGNICRSPFAAMLLDDKAWAAGIDLDVISAGTIEREGRTSPPHAIAAARRFGADLAAHRSRHLADDTLAAADLVVVFDERNVDQLMGFGAGRNVNLLRLGDFAGASEIGDPYGHPPDIFVATYGTIERAVDRLVASIARAR